MNALFGQASSLKGEQEIDTMRALRWMGSEKYRDLSMKTMKALGTTHEKVVKHKQRSVRQLAKDAAKIFFAGQEDCKAETLRKQFAEEKDKWVEVAHTHDDVHETIETNILVKILKLLKKAGIDAKPAW